jgi:uncharacterized protein YcbX
MLSPGRPPALGLRHDRRWLVLKPHGTVLTARTWHSMLSLSAAPLDTGRLRRAVGMATCSM